ncbi:MAG: hypothetical protein WC326_12805 [Candidatus Delongbacteria bacterium]
MSILRIKLVEIQDPAKRQNVRRELDELEAVARTHGLAHPELEQGLDEVNAELWRIEDELRVLEREQRFDARFIELARAVYYTNDRRARLKRELNAHFGSALVEEKQYVEYGGPVPPGSSGP